MVPSKSPDFVQGCRSCGSPKRWRSGASFVSSCAERENRQCLSSNSVRWYDDCFRGRASAHRAPRSILSYPRPDPLRSQRVHFPSLLSSNRSAGLHATTAASALDPRGGGGMEAAALCSAARRLPKSLISMLVKTVSLQNCANTACKPRPSPCCDHVRQSHVASFFRTPSHLSTVLNLALPGARRSAVRTRIILHLVATYSRSTALRPRLRRPASDARWRHSRD